MEAVGAREQINFRVSHGLGKSGDDAGSAAQVQDKACGGGQWAWDTRFWRGSVSPSTEAATWRALTALALAPTIEFHLF
jgi:hypothetical protein